MNRKKLEYYVYSYRVVAFVQVIITKFLTNIMLGSGFYSQQRHISGEAVQLTAHLDV